MMISVIVPTRNRVDYLRQALSSLVEQTIPQDEFEVLVIDNGSTDSTAQLTEEYSQQLLNLSRIYKPEPGLHIGRHAGMQAAKGDLLVFADDDIEAMPSWLASIKDAFSDVNVAMIGGNNYPLFLEEPPSWLMELWNQGNIYGYKAIPSLSVIQFTKIRNEISPHLVWGCNFSIRKSVLMDAGGFHPDGMPKELIRFRGDGETHVSRFVIESGLKCMFHPGASVYHKVTPERMSLSYFRKRGFSQGVSDSYTALRNQDAKKTVEKKNLLYRIASRGLRSLKNWIFLSSEARQALSELKQGHREGYAYHQKCYASDPEVCAWVHKQNYY